jgi:hypothetical protein
MTRNLNLAHRSAACRRWAGSARSDHKALKKLGQETDEVGDVSRLAPSPGAIDATLSPEFLMSGGPEARPPLCVGALARRSTADGRTRTAARNACQHGKCGAGAGKALPGACTIEGVRRAALHHRRPVIRLAYRAARRPSPADPLRRKNPFLLRGPCRDVIHECGREAIIRLQLQLLEPRPNGIHT